MLTKEKLEERHSAQNYKNYVDGLISMVQKEPEGLKKLRLREGLAKTLMEESFPLACMATKYFDSNPEVFIKLKVANQNYDAIVEDNRSGHLVNGYIEITQAREGETDYLRSLVLHQNGHVSALGPVIKEGTKKSGMKVEVKSVAVLQQEILVKESMIVEHAMIRKAGKPYPDNTILLIAFDDVMAFDRQDNIENIEATVDRLAADLSNFSKVVLIGLTKNLCIERDINGTN